MSDVRVECITKPNRETKHEHITHLGGTGGGGWRWAREQVIASIEQRTNTFFVLDPVSKKRSEVGIVKPTDGRAPFLRTHADGIWNDNLLALPQCPIP